MFHRFSRRPSRGFSLIEIAIAVAVVIAAAVPILQMIGSVVDNNGESVTSKTSRMQNTVVTVNNIIQEVSVGTFSDIAVDLATLADAAGDMAHSTGSITENGQTLYWNLDIINQRYLVDEDYDLIDFSGAGVLAASAEEVTPFENRLYQANLSIYSDVGRTELVTGIPFNFASSQCTVADYCDAGSAAGASGAGGLEQTSIMIGFDIARSVQAAIDSNGTRLEAMQDMVNDMLDDIEADPEMAAKIQVGLISFKDGDTNVEEALSLMPFTNLRADMATFYGDADEGDVDIDDVLGECNTAFNASAWGDGAGHEICLIITDGFSDQAAAVSTATTMNGAGQQVMVFSLMQDSSMLEAVTTASNGTYYEAYSRPDLDSAYNALLGSLTPNATEDDFWANKACRFHVNNSECAAGPVCDGDPDCVG